MTNSYGYFRLIIGPMFSGKTTSLISRYRRYTLGGKKCIMIKYAGDDRYDENCIVTHDNIKVQGVKTSLLGDIEHLIKDYDVICIDEIQFYKDGYIFCDKWANEGKIVEACGLNGTFDRKPFDSMSKLYPLVDDMVYKTAVCKKTGNDAQYSKLMIDKTNESSIIIGGGDIYTATDRQTFYEDLDYYNTIRNYFSQYIDTLIEDYQRTMVYKKEYYLNAMDDYINYLKENNMKLDKTFNELISNFVV